MTTLTLKSKLSRRIAVLVGLFLALILMILGSISFTYLISNDQKALERSFVDESNRLRFKLGLLEPRAKQLASNWIVPSSPFPFDDVDKLTKLIEEYDFDLGWAFRITEKGDVKPWIDARRRLVLDSAKEDYIATIISNLESYPWPQNNEKDSRIFRFQVGGGRKIESLLS